MFTRSLASLASPAAPPPTTPPASYNLFAPAAAFKPVHTATQQAHTAKNKHGGVGGGENHQRDGVAASSTRPFRRLRQPHGTSGGSPDVPEARPEPSLRPRAPPASSSCPGNRNSRFKVRGQFNIDMMRSYQTPTDLPHRCRCPAPQLSSPPVHTMPNVY